VTLTDPWICPACGAHYPPHPSPPARCRICEDERQYVPPGGQRWTTLVQLAQEGYRTEVREVEPDLLGIGTDPGVGVGQRGLLVRTDAGNLLWDPPAFLDEAALQAVWDAGGLRAVSASHPHMYGAMVEYSREFDAPAVLAADDLAWLMRPPERPVDAWSGTREVLPGVTLIQCGGHFRGSAVVHWAQGAGGRGALFTGDTIFVAPGEDRVTSMWSAPNRLPLSSPAVGAIAAAVAPYRYERIYGGWWTPVVRRDGGAVVQRSAARYRELLQSTPAGDAPPEDAPSSC
jgi:glyoxylase-like metal-dependent hydrolase (beta-lactamase superfamily II)